MAQRWFIGVFGALALTVGAALIWSFTAYTDVVYVCEYTASRYGYRQLFTGQRVGNWHTISPLESFVSVHAPGTLSHKWTKCAGTGKNIFGDRHSFGHGSPGGAVLLSAPTLNVWMSHHSNAEILSLYKFLQHASIDESTRRAMEIRNEIAKAM